MKRRMITKHDPVQGVRDAVDELATRAMLGEARASGVGNVIPALMALAREGEERRTGSAGRDDGRGAGAFGGRSARRQQRRGVAGWNRETARCGAGSGSERSGSDEFRCDRDDVVGGRSRIDVRILHGKRRSPNVHRGDVADAGAGRARRCSEQRRDQRGFSKLPHDQGTRRVSGVSEHPGSGA